MRTLHRLPRGEAERVLRGLVAVPSPTGETAEAVEFLVEHARRLGFDARRDAAGNFLAQCGRGTPRIAFVGHVDTVPGEIPVRVEGRELWGRGAVDAKGPLVAFLAAATRFLDEGPSITVAATVDEEGASESVRALNLEGPDAIVVGEPSGWDGVTLGYKGTAKLALALRRDVAHGSRPEPTAAEAAADLWAQLRQRAAQRTTGQSPFTSFTLSLRSLTTSSGGLSDEARLLLDARVPVGFELDAFLGEAEAIARENGATLEVSGREAPVKVEPSTPLVRALTKAVRDEGGSPAYKLKAGTSDMAFLASRCRPPLGICAYGPGNAEHDHTPRERIDLDEFGRGVAVLERALASLADRTA